MKTILGTFQVLLAASMLVHAQDESNPPLIELQAATTARILGEIPDGTPPPPQPPKPEYRIAERDVLSTVTHQQGGRTITIRQIKPIALPPPPAPAPAAVPSEAEADYQQILDDYREANPKSGLMLVGATVFRPKEGPPRTLVRIWPEGHSGTVTFWSSADFALIAGGINSFADATGNTHYLLMGWGNEEIDHISELNSDLSKDFDAPKLPTFSEDKATFHISGDAPPAETLIAVQSLHDLYNKEYERLKTAHASRERARLEREEYLKANPPQTEDITLNYWRTTKPASKGKGEP